MNNFFFLFCSFSRAEDEDDDDVDDGNGDEDDATSLVSSHTLTDETANGTTSGKTSKTSTSIASTVEDDDEECSTDSNKVNNDENLNRNSKDDGVDIVEDIDDDNISLKSKSIVDVELENYSVDTPLSLRKAIDLVAEVKRNDSTLKRITKADVSAKPEATNKMKNVYLSASNATLTNVRFSFYSLTFLQDFPMLFFRLER